MNTSVEIRSGRFTVIDDPEESGQGGLNSPTDNQSAAKAQPLVDNVSSSSSTYSPSDRGSPSAAFDTNTPQHAYASHDPHSIGSYSSHTQGEVYTLSDVQPSALHRATSESAAKRAAQAIPESPDRSRESSVSSKSTGYDSSSESEAEEAEGASPLSGAAMRRSGRFTVIDDEDNGASGSSERVLVDNRGQALADQSMQYDRVQSTPDEQRSAAGSEEKYSGREQQSDSYAELLRRQQMHSDDPELTGGQHERPRRTSTVDVEHVYDSHHPLGQHGHGQAQHQPVYEQPSQVHEQYEQQAAYDQQQYEQQHQQQQYEQAQYEQQQQQQRYEQQQYSQQQYEQQEQQQQQQYDPQQYDPSSSPQHYEQSPQSQHVSYSDEQQLNAYSTADDPNSSAQQYANSSTLYDEQQQAGSPSPDQYGDGQGGLDLDALASECGPLNLFNMLYQQVAKVMEENEWLKAENAQLRDDNYELQARLGYTAQQQQPPHSADTPSELSNSASPDYLSPQHSPSRLMRSVTTDPHHALNATSPSHYADEALTKTAPIRSFTELTHGPSHHNHLNTQRAPSPSPSVERAEEENGGAGAESGEARRVEVQADGREAEQFAAGNGVVSPHLTSNGPSTLSRPNSVMARALSSSSNGAVRTSSANSVASSASPSSATQPSLPTSSSSSPAHAAKPAKRKPSVTLKAELSPSKGSTMSSLASTLPALPSVSFASNSAASSASSASSAPSLLSAPRKASLTSATKASPLASTAAATNGVKKSGAVTPRKKSVTGASGKPAAASKPGKGNFFTPAGGGSDPLDQFLSQTMSGLSGLCSTAAPLIGKSAPSAAAASADKSKPSASSASAANGDAAKGSRNSSASSRDAINVLAASLHLKPRLDKDKPAAEAHSPGVSGVSSARAKDDGAESKVNSKSGGGGGVGLLDESKAYAPSFGVGANKAKHDSDNLFL